jgi:hypothetical protein
MNDIPGDAKLDKNKPVGELGGGAAVAALDEDDSPIELDNAAIDAPLDGPSGKKAKSKKNKKLAIPDFNKFRVWLMLGGLGLVVVIFLFYIALGVMPRSTIVVKTDSTAVDANIDMTLSTDATDADVNARVIPAKSQQTQKTTNQEVPTTGQKDKGTKATGTIVFYNCNLQDLIFGSSASVPAGTAVSTGGLTFITTSSVSVPPSHFKGDNTCKKDVPSDTVGITSQNAGDKYNVAAADYAVAGNSTVTGRGSATSGGTSVIVKIVAQADIESAKQKIAALDNTAVKDELKQALEGQGMIALDSTLSTGTPEVTTSASVGDEADAVSVTQKTTFTMIGAKQGDLKKLIANEVNKHIDPNRQSILDYGLSTAVFKLQSQEGADTLISLQATAIAGSDLDITSIKKQVAGKKAGQAKELIGKYPGVTSVEVKYSPFWVSSIPKKTSKITISVEKPAVKNAN